MSELIAHSFFNDDAVQGAQKILLERLATHQEKITGIKPPKKELIKSYEEVLADFSRLRGGQLYYPYLGSGIGKGALVELADGSIKYDFIGGIGVHYFGHSHPDLVAASMKAALGDTIMQGNLQQNLESYDLSKKLLKAACAKGAQLAHAFVSTTGVMAGENAMKIAFQEKHPAHRVLAFENCFAGRTLAMSQVTDKPAYRVGLPHNLSVDYVPFFDEKNPELSIERSCRILKRHLKRHPGQYAGMVFELVQGEGGFYPGSKAFHQALMEICKEEGVLVLVDEVQTFARTPEMFAFQYFELDQYVDVVWIGKTSQICATLFKEDLKPKPGLLSQTFTASSSAIAAANVILDHFLEGDYFGPKGKVVRLHEYAREGLESLAKKMPQKLSGPFGIGAMLPFTPLGGDPKKATEFVKKLFKNGVIAFVAGANPTRVRFLLPIAAIEEKDIDAVLGVVEQTLVEM